MVLNEMIGSAPYNVIEGTDPHSGPVFRCSVLVEGTEHFGSGMPFFSFVKKEDITIILKKFKEKMDF